jgi:hypothetical protein
VGLVIYAVVIMIIAWYDGSAFSRCYVYHNSLIRSLNRNIPKRTDRFDWRIRADEETVEYFLFIESKIHGHLSERATLRRASTVSYSIQAP